MHAIFFRGKAFSASKRFFEGTHRISSPEETWEKISPLAKKIGVTRVANITGLDRIGIPVTVSIRPTAQTLATSSGKGISLITAMVSGLMESLELYCAEEFELPFLHLSYNQLIKQVPAMALEDLHYRSRSLFHPDWPERWSLGWDLFQQEEVAVPTLSVTMNSRFNAREPTELFSFQMSSNGIASGNHFLEALLSGIYEVIERDAVACHMYAADTTRFFSPRVRLETIPYNSVQKLLDQLKRADIQPLLYDCTIDTKVPVFMTTIYDKRSTHIGCAKGYGAHLDPEVAMIRAITEAVQGRTVAIAGSRDDMFPSHIELLRKCDTQDLRKAYENVEATVDASIYHSEACKTLEEEVHVLMKKLNHVGISRLIVFDLTRNELGIPALRVIIPGLEDYYTETSSARRRAKAFASQHTPVSNQGILPSQKAAHFPAGAL